MTLKILNSETPNITVLKQIAKSLSCELIIGRRKQKIVQILHKKGIAK